MALYDNPRSIHSPENSDYQFLNFLKCSRKIQRVSSNFLINGQIIVNKNFRLTLNKNGDLKI